MFGLMVTPSGCELGASSSEGRLHSRFDSAMDVYEKMQQRGIEADTFTLTALMTACEKVGKWRQALEVFQALQASGVRPNTICYNSLINALGGSGQWAQVRTLRM
jgi:pentatricopeptide repeat domain-containing protein 1